METNIETDVINIAMQGGAGAFHEMAACKFFDSRDIEKNLSKHSKMFSSILLPAKAIALLQPSKIR